MRAMKTLSTIVIGAMLGCGAVVAAGADEYPSRPITMVVPFAAGGPTDVVGRVMAEHMGRTLRQHWRRPRRESDSRRLHARHRPLEHACGQRRGLRAAL